MTETDVLHGQTCGCAACLRDRDEAAATTGGDDGPVAAPNGAGSLQDLGDYLRAGFWTERKFNLASGTGTNPKDGTLTYNVSGFASRGGYADADGLTEPRRALTREAFKLLEATLGIDFQETTSETDADLYFFDNGSGAFASPRGSTSGLSYSMVNVAKGWSGGTSTYDDYTLQTILHEIGHALGLGHQGAYNGSGRFADDALFDNDSWQLSMMSYFSQTENPNTNASYEFLQTPMAADWVALDDLYGPRGFGTANAFTGDTVYGVGTSISSAVSDIWASFADYAGRTASTIVDGGGIDTLDVSNTTRAQRIDLAVAGRDDTEATTMDIGGRVGNLMLAAGTVIENARGGAGADTFAGNAADNVFWGGGGDDTFADSDGDDTYFGEGGSADMVVFDGAYATYAFSTAGSFLEVIAGGFVDLVANTVEFLGFGDGTHSFASVLATAATGTLPTVAIERAVDDAGPVTGALDPRDATDDDNPTLEGGLSAPLGPGQSVQVLRDGAVVGTAAVSGTDWTFGDAAVGEGVHTWEARVVSGATVGETSRGFTLRIDRTGPEVAVDALVTEDLQPTIGGTADATADVVRVTVDDVTTEVAVVDGRWRLTPDAPLGEGTYDVEVEAVDTAGNVSTDGTANELTIDLPDPLKGALEIGSVTFEQPDRGTWTAVSFSQPIADAVVVMGPMTFAGQSPATTRVRNVTETGFEVQIEEWDYLDGYHAAETLGWIAASAGSFEIDGLTVVAGTRKMRDDDRKSVDFGDAFTDAPVVFAQIASDNGRGAVTDRIGSVDAGGFRLTMDEEEGADGRHKREALDWIAIEAGAAPGFEVGRTGQTVDDTGATVTFAPRETDTLAFVADMQTWAGRDPATVRLTHLDGTSADIFIEEEASRDDELVHADEVVGWLAADAGLYLA